MLSAQGCAARKSLQCKALQTPVSSLVSRLKHQTETILPHQELILLQTPVFWLPEPGKAGGGGKSAVRARMMKRIVHPVSEVLRLGTGDGGSGGKAPGAAPGTSPASSSAARGGARPHARGSLYHP